MTEQEAIKDISENIKPYVGGKSLDIAIKALEEIKQYRAIESELREQYHANVDIKMLMNYFIETIFKGEKHDRFCILTNEDADKWEAYKAIGTPEECRAAVEKMKPKKTAIEAIKVHICPVCGFSGIYDYCGNCGQRVQMLSD